MPTPRDGTPEQLAPGPWVTDGDDAATDRAPTPPDACPAVDWDAEVEELALLSESDAAACVRRAAELVDRAAADGDARAELRVRYHAAVAHHVLGDDSAALRHAERSEALAHACDELVWQSRALARQGVVHHDLGHVEDAVDLLTRAAALRREADDVTGTADVLTVLGSVYTAMPHFAPQAAAVLTEARRLWLAAGDPDRASIALAHLARTFVATARRIGRSNPRGARASARQALTLALEAADESDAAGLARTAVEARVTAAEAHALAGDLAEAERLLDAAREMVARLGVDGQALTLHRVRSALLLDLGRHDEAAAEASAGLALDAALHRPADRASLLDVLVAAQEARGDLAAALAALHERHDLTVALSDTVAERRAALLGTRMEVEHAERMAEAERRRSQALEASNARLAHEATHDALTGLPNRRVLEAELERCAAGDEVFAVALVDIDHFKLVNDRWSHQTGDVVLARVARTLHDGLRSADVAARYGGEEFALVLAARDTAAAERAGERLRAAVAALRWDGPMVGHRLTVSIGIAMHRGGSVHDTLAAADVAVYRAKREGRDRVCVVQSPA